MSVLLIFNTTAESRCGNEGRNFTCELRFTLAHIRGLYAWKQICMIGQKVAVSMCRKTSICTMLPCSINHRASQTHRSSVG